MMLRDKSVKSFVLFILAGGINTLVGYIAFATFILSGIASELSLLFATVIGVVFNFFTTGRIAFAGSSRRSFLRFVAVYGVAYVLNAFALRMLSSAGLSPLIGQILLLPVNVTLTFLALQTYVFRERI